MALASAAPLLYTTSPPLHCFFLVALHSKSTAVHDCEIVLSHSIPLFGRRPIPLHRQVIVLWNSIPVFVRFAKLELCRCIARPRFRIQVNNCRGRKFSGLTRAVRGRRGLRILSGTS